MRKWKKTDLSQKGLVVRISWGIRIGINQKYLYLYLSVLDLQPRANPIKRICLYFLILFFKLDN